MTRDEMMEALIPAFVNSGETLAGARRRLWRMSASTLEREMLLRGLADYDDPAPLDDEGDAGDDYCDRHTMPVWREAPLYLD